MKQEEFYDILENHLGWLGNRGEEETVQIYQVLI